MREQVANPRDAAGRIEAGLARVNQQWAAYRARDLGPEEKRLAADMQVQVDRNAAIVAGSSGCAAGPSTVTAPPTSRSIR